MTVVVVKLRDRLLHRFLRLPAAGAPPDWVRNRNSPLTITRHPDDQRAAG